MRNPQMHDWLTRNDGLAARLRAARGDMPAKDLAENAGWLPSKVSKIESGKQLPSVEDLKTWGRLTGASDVLVGQWEVMRVEAYDLRHDFEVRMRDGQKAVQADYNVLIEATTQFRFFEMTFVPRFLQIPEYTRAILTEQHRRHGGIEDIDAAVAERQKSVNHLYEPGRTFEIIIDEGVLRRLNVDPGVMRSQMDRLQTIIGLPSVRFGIIPFGRRIMISPPNSVELYGDIGYVETYIGDDPKLLVDVVEKYNRYMDELWQAAVEGDEARQIINTARASLPAE